MDAQTANVVGLQDYMPATNASLLLSSAKHEELNDKPRRVSSQHATGATVPDDLKLVAGACERPEKRVKLTRPCEESSTTSLTAVFFALLTKRDDLKIALKS